MNELEERLRGVGGDLQLDLPVAVVMARGDVLRRRRRVLQVGVASGAVVVIAAMSSLAGFGGQDPGAGPGASERPSVAGSTQGGEPGVRPLSREQLAALEGGHVTRSEYRAGFSRLVACMESRGGQLTDVHVVKGVFEYSYAATPANEKAYGYCYRHEFEQLDILWQLAHEHPR